MAEEVQRTDPAAVAAGPGVAADAAAAVGEATGHPVPAVAAGAAVAEEQPADAAVAAGPAVDTGTAGAAVTPVAGAATVAADLEGAGWVTGGSPAEALAAVTEQQPAVLTIRVDGSPIRAVADQPAAGAQRGGIRLGSPRVE